MIHLIHFLFQLLFPFVSFFFRFFLLRFVDSINYSFHPQTQYWNRVLSIIGGHLFIPARPVDCFYRCWSIVLSNFIVFFDKHFPPTLFFLFYARSCRWHRFRLLFFRCLITPQLQPHLSRSEDDLVSIFTPKPLAGNQNKQLFFVAAQTRTCTYVCLARRPTWQTLPLDSILLSLFVFRINSSAGPCPCTPSHSSILIVCTYTHTHLRSVCRFVLTELVRQLVNQPATRIVHYAFRLDLDLNGKKST